MSRDDTITTEPIRMPPGIVSLPPGGGRYRPAFFKGGYGAYTRTSYVLITVFNILLAIVLLLVSSPLMILLSLAVWARNGRPVFYRGVRMGLNKKPFMMYKFRTLPRDAQQRIGGDILSSDHGMTTPFTRLLRDSRLDELPQLLNILRGDMDFVGPRPMRPEQYEEQCRDIPNYDLRFDVRPGLVGYSQLFTPHSSPKRIRALIDNKFVNRKRSLLWDILIVGYTGLVFLRITAFKGLIYVWRHVVRLHLFNKQEARVLDRIQQNALRTKVRLAVDGGWGGEAYPVFDINENYLRMHSNQNLDGVFDFRLEKQARFKGRRKAKRTHLCGEVYKKIPLDVGEYAFAYIVKYHPATPLQRYLVDQYFLFKSFA